MEIIAVIVLLVLIAAFFGLYIASAAWVVGDAQKRGHGGGIIILLLWVFGPLAALVWLMVRPTTKIIEKLPSDYDNPDAAIDAALRLESLGEWDAAIDLYRDAARRWPEHDGYIQQCVSRIKAKQALAS